MLKTHHETAKCLVALLLDPVLYKYSNCLKSLVEGDWIVLTN